MMVESSPVEGVVEKKRSKRRRTISLTDLPTEILWRVLRFVDCLTAAQPLASIVKHGVRDFTKFHRRSMLSIRTTCTSLKDITSSPFVWASHLLMASNALSLSSISSMSPFKHTEESLRLVKTLVIVIEDSLASFRDHHQILLDMLLQCRLHTFVLVRRSTISENFVRSQILTEPTPAELLIQHLCGETALLLNMRRLCLVNVAIRPSIVKMVYNNCPRLTRIETHWSNVAVPRLRTAKKKLQNESMLLSVQDPMPMGANLAVPHREADDHAVRFIPQIGTKTVLSHDAQLLLEFEPTRQVFLSHLCLSGPSAPMLSKKWLSPSLQQLKLDFSSLDDLPLWERLRHAFEFLPSTCPLLSTFALTMGQLNAKYSIDLSGFIDKLFTPHLEVLATDVTISTDLVPTFSTALFNCSSLKILELRFSSKVGPTSTAPTAGISNFPSFPAPTPPSGVAFTSSGSTTTYSQNAPPTFLPQMSNFGALASLFARTNIPTSASPASVSSAKCESTSKSILNALSNHCRDLRRLRITTVDSQSSEFSESWTSLRFPNLVYLKYNLGEISRTAFDEIEEAFPALSYLDLSHAKISDPVSSLSGLCRADGLLQLRLKGCAVDSRCLMSLFESRKASSSISKLDLRVAHPFGLDDLLLRRIGASCGSNLSSLSFSVAQPSMGSTGHASSVIPHHSFASLLQSCRRLKTIRTTENSSISAVTAELIRQKGVQLVRS